MAIKVISLRWSSGRSATPGKIGDTLYTLCYCLITVHRFRLRTSSLLLLLLRITKAYRRLEYVKPKIHIFEADRKTAKSNLRLGNCPRAFFKSDAYEGTQC